MQFTINVALFTPHGSHFWFRVEHDGSEMIARDIAGQLRNRFPECDVTLSQRQTLRSEIEF